MSNAPKIDRTLLGLLKSETGLIEAVVQLRGPRPDQEFAAPEETESLAQTVIRAVELATGLRAADSHVFKNLSSFVVSGPSDFIRGFGDLEEVRAVVANRQPASAMIPPRNVKPVRRSGSKAAPRRTTQRTRDRG